MKTALSTAKGERRGHVPARLALAYPHLLVIELVDQAGGCPDWSGGWGGDEEIGGSTPQSLLAARPRAGARGRPVRGTHQARDGVRVPRHAEWQVPHPWRQVSRRTPR